MNEVYKTYRVHVYFTMGSLSGRESYSIKTYSTVRARAKVKERFEYETQHDYAKNVRYEVVS